MTGNQNLTWATIYNNRLHLGYCSGTSTPNTILCLDLTLNAWTTLVPGFAISSMVLFDAPQDPNPYTCYVGSAASGNVSQWDYVPAVSSGNVYDGASSTLPVLAQVQSKYFKIGVPGTNKALQRFYPEFQISGAFSTNFTVSTDYGLVTTQAETTSRTPVTSVGIYDQSTFDQAVFGGSSTFVPFGPPLSRLDFTGPQGESFAFGLMMTNPSAPWVWSGGTGVFNQRGRT